MDTVTIFSLFIFIVILTKLLYTRFKGGPGPIGQLMDFFYTQFSFFEELLQPVFRYLNPYPFQSMLLQFFICYLIFFSIFITKPLPILKSYPTATNIVLIGFLIFFFLALFIQFVVPFTGIIITKKGFNPNIRHFKQNIGIYGGFLMSIFIILLLSIGISYLAAHHTTMSWYVMVAAITLLCLVILHTVWTFINQFTSINIPSFPQIISQKMFIDMIDNIKHVFMTTPWYIYILLAIELSFIIAYFVVPMLGNLFYLRDPGNKDYDSLLTLNVKDINSQLAIKKEYLTEMKGNIDKRFDWYNAMNIDDQAVITELISLGYTAETAPNALEFIRQNQEKVLFIYKDVSNLEDEHTRLMRELKEETHFASKQLLGTARYTDNLIPLGTTFEGLQKGDLYNYKYSLSAWFFIHNQPPNYSLSSTEFTSLLNYGDKPNILYNVKEQILQIKVKTNTEEKIVFETHDFPLQKWNNIVINYDQGTLDIFINAKLVKTIPMVIPDMKYGEVSAGSSDGISGGICNVVYYSGNLSKDRIEFFL